MYLPKTYEDFIKKFPKVLEVLANPQVFLLSAGDINILPRILDAAARDLPGPADSEMQSLVADSGLELIFDGPRALNGSQ